MSSEFACPFCGSEQDTEYAILLHLETQHAEGKSPFVADEGPMESEGDMSAAEEDQFTECPIDGCGEIITLAELEDHIELHGAEQPEEQPEEHPRVPAPHHGRSRGTASANGGYQSPYSHGRNVPRTARVYQPDERLGPVERWKQIFNMSTRRPLEPLGPVKELPRKRLGKSELGKYAHEDRMPNWLISLLKTGGYESSEGMITVLEQLLQQNPETQCAYLCHPAVHHISKLRKEGKLLSYSLGGFCGYRNIQMLASYIVGASATGAEVFRGKVPSIFRIQDYIENAWDMGINTQGRIETGGVKGTRKYIGTPEAQAVFLSLNIPCEAQAFKNPDAGAAEALLFNAVERYFESTQCSNPQAKVRCTSLAPIYFQHRGHSLTIVGLEKRRNGTSELLVFDPMFHDPAGITRYIGRRFQHKDPDKVLKLYRRGSKYLKKYHEFEVLRLTSRPAIRDIPAIVS
ncbi:hypothetical protein AAE478_004680 [Parahypoxylon ruwenzoriense]